MPGAAAARAKGGYGKATVARLGRKMPRRIAGLFELLENALAEVHNGKLTPAQGTAMAALANVMLKILEVSELEDRLGRLEALTARHDNGRALSWPA